MICQPCTVTGHAAHHCEDAGKDHTSCCCQHRGNSGTATTLPVTSARDSIGITVTHTPDNSTNTATNDQSGKVERDELTR